MKAAKTVGRAMKWRVRGGALLAVLCALAVAIPGLPATAGAAGVRLGYYGGRDAEDPVATVGVYDRWDVPGPLNLEFSADYRREQLLGGDLEATVIPVRVSAVLNFLPVVSPYLLAGVGVDYVHAGFHHHLSALDSQMEALFEVHAGAGVEITLGPFDIIGDLRYCRVGETSKETVREALGHDYDPSGWYASLSAGISF